LSEQAKQAAEVKPAAVHEFKEFKRGNGTVARIKKKQPAAAEASTAQPASAADPKPAGKAKPILIGLAIGATVGAVVLTVVVVRRRAHVQPVAA
jgi:hypothetical protein